LSVRIVTEAVFVSCLIIVRVAIGADGADAQRETLVGEISEATKILADTEKQIAELEQQ
jgi:hypothetical protein